MWAGGSDYFTPATVRMGPGRPLRSGPCGLWGLSSYGNSASQETCAADLCCITGALGRSASRLHTSKEMPRNSKSITTNLNVLLSQLTDVKSQWEGEWIQGKSEFLTHKPTLLLVILTHVPKCPQRVSQVHSQMAPPRDHTGPQMDKYSLPEKKCFLLTTEISGGN